MRGETKTLLFTTFSFLLIFMSSALSVAVIHTDKSDYLPTDIVSIIGENFLPNHLVQLTITPPVGPEIIDFTHTDSYGYFTYSYGPDLFTGTYFVEATDSTNFATTTFTDSSGAIWTTKNDCGNETQDVNQYSIGDQIYINGNNFAPGLYSWDISGTPGSCHNGSMVVNGTYLVDASGAFCFYIDTVDSSYCGEYKVNFDTKNDNFRVLEPGETTTTTAPVTTTTQPVTTTTPVITTTQPVTTTTPVITTTQPVTTTTPTAPTTTTPLETTTCPPTTTVPNPNPVPSLSIYSMFIVVSLLAIIGMAGIKFAV